ncbi:hypothetical protein STANM309S_00046 [Streptomyces tanashiensis]
MAVGAGASAVGFSAGAAVCCGAEVVGAAVVGVAVGSLSGPSKRSFRASPTPSGSSGFVDFVGEAVAVGVAAGAGAFCACSRVCCAAVCPVAVAVGVGVADGVAGADGVAVAEGVSVGLTVAVAVGLALSSGFAVSVASGVGSSERVTQGPGAKGTSLSSARASLGVRPMPTNTAVGIAASAIAFPAGPWILFSSDLRGAACRGPSFASAD